MAYAEYGSGPPLLLIHGLMVSGGMFESVIARFAAHRRVIVPDLRGHGLSRDLPPPYDAAHMAADLAALLDHLGIGAADVLGYSQGGAVAQQFALDFPARCRRLVLACTYAYNMATFRETIEGYAMPILLRLLGPRRFTDLVIANGMKGVDPALAGRLKAIIGGQDPAKMTSAWRTAMAFDSRPRLREIRCPTLVLAAENDEAVPSHHAKMLHDGIPGSKLVVIADAGHALIWQKPDAFVRAVEDFLGPLA